jgi:hypothetical protein
MESVKETKELVIALNEVLILLADKLKDGVQAKDAVEVFEKLKNDAEFAAKLLAAYNDVEKVSAELKDINLVEGIELVKIQVEYLPKLVDAIKKPVVVAQA